MRHLSELCVTLRNLLPQTSYNEHKLEENQCAANVV